MSVLLRLAYDGTAFHGYAAQPGQRTVQGEVQRHLGEMFSDDGLEVRAASRTDAGVHARGQLVAFEKTLPIPPEGVAKGLNGRLPDDVAVVDAWEETGPEGSVVEPRFGNGGKHYRYRLVHDRVPDPFRDRTAWRLEHSLDVECMGRAAQQFVGTHDFAAFRSSDCQASTTARTITKVEVRVSEIGAIHGGVLDAVVIDVEGQAFLKRMVRVMVGTLVEIGRGRLRAEAIPRALQSGVRADAGPTGPAHGLCLMEVKWPGRPMPAPLER